MKLHFTRDEVEARRSRATSYHPVVWPCQNEDDWLTLMDEVERLQPIVNKLAKTADGEYVTSMEQSVWHPEYGRMFVITGQRARPEYIGYYHKIQPIAKCYSTQAAAEAAGEKGDSKTDDE